MNTSALLVIDVQNGFINRETAHIPRRIRELIIRHQFEEVIFTKFINKKGSFFEAEVGWCGMYSSPDTDIVPELSDVISHIFVKSGYTSFTEDVCTFLKDMNIKEIYIVGLETDACVLKTALDAIELGYRLIVLSNYCATMAGNEVHDFAIHLMKRQLGNQNVRQEYAENFL